MTRGTLGALLYAADAREHVASESAWVAVVRSIAAGDRYALHELYDRAHRVVFTLVLRITGDRGIAEQLTLGVFHDVWRCAGTYDAASGSVIGWVLDQARARTVDRMRIEQRAEGAEPVDRGRRSRLLEAAIAALTAEEREALEAASGSAPSGTLDARVRSGLRQLWQALAAEMGALSSAPASRHGASHSERVFAYALQVLPAGQVGITEAKILLCAGCREELGALRPILDESLVPWPSDLLRPSASLRGRLAQRIATETGGELVLPLVSRSAEPEWRNVAPGISCKLLSAGPEQERVSMLVRLAPGATYPPHRHAGLEELYLLNGELGIDDRQLVSGDYAWAEADSADRRVSSETGCTCLLITSDRDELLPDAR